MKIKIKAFIQCLRQSQGRMKYVEHRERQKSRSGGKSWSDRELRSQSGREPEAKWTELQGEKGIFFSPAFFFSFRSGISGLWWRSTGEKMGDKLR